MEESGVLWLQDEVVGLLGLEQLDHLLAAHTVFKTVLHQMLEVGAPATKVVVHVDNRHLRAAGTLAQLGQVPGRRQSLPQHLFAAPNSMSLIMSMISSAASQLSGALP